MAGEVTTLGHRRVQRARPPRTASWCRRLRAAGRGADRQDEPARAGDHRRHRGPGVRDHPQPLGPGRARRAARAAAAPPRWPPACAPAATASDGAGSIRIPAANCGLVGPQAAARPDAAGARYRALDGLSVLRLRDPHVADTALLLDVGARHAPGDAPRTRPRPTRAARAGCGWRSSTRARAVPACTPSADGARGDGRAAARARARTWRRATPTTAMAAGNALAPRYLRGIAEDVARVPAPGPPPAAHARVRRLGGPVSHERRRAGTARRRARTPSASTGFSRTSTCCSRRRPAPPVGAGRVGGDGRAAHAARDGDTIPTHAVWNATGQPRAAVPRRHQRHGLPIGVQLVGPPDGEETLLSLAAQLEAEVGWPERRPPVS